MTFQQIDGARQIKDASIPASKFVDGVLPSYDRLTATRNTPSLAQYDEWSGTMDVALGYRLLHIETNRPARVRLYVDTDYRDADAARILGAPPSGDHGCILEYVTTAGLLAAYLSPIVDGATFTGDETVAALIQNLDTTTGVVDLDLLYTVTEE